MEHHGMDLNELIDKVKAELKSTGYSDSWIGGLTTVWNSLTDYMVRNGKEFYTAKIGMDFLEAEYGLTVYKKIISQKKSVVSER